MYREIPIVRSFRGLFQTAIVTSAHSLHQSSWELIRWVRSGVVVLPTLVSAYIVVYQTK